LPHHVHLPTSGLKLSFPLAHIAYLLLAISDLTGFSKPVRSQARLFGLLFLLFDLDNLDTSITATGWADLMVQP
ncbi:MAG: hypothetical protein KAX26_02800, partial [Anaerolineae bacterium]|nr:hypothetical protein [Anaerolineae bacterium]